jgi:AraC-like DNA-binding protein
MVLQLREQVAGVDTMSFEGSVRSPHVRRMVNLIEERAGEHLSIRVLACAVGRQEAYLGRLFRQQMGVSVRDYLTQVRMRRAACMICQGDKVEAVALEVGYRSKKNFYRQFIRSFGMLPAAYRRRQTSSGPRPEVAQVNDSHGRIRPDLTFRSIGTGIGGSLASDLLPASTSPLECRGRLTALVRSATAPWLIYVGTDDGAVRVSRDGGETWTMVMEPCHTRRRVTAISTSPRDAETAYVAFDGEQDPDERLYMTTDAGRSWLSISSNLPRVPVNVIREDPRNPSLLYLGTEMGLFVSFDRGHAWTNLKANLPAVAVDDVAVHPKGTDLVVLTRGGGIWILDDVTALRRSQALLPPGKGQAETSETVETDREVRSAACDLLQHETLNSVARLLEIAGASVTVLGALRAQLRHVHETLLSMPNVPDLVRGTWNHVAHAVSDLMRQLGSGMSPRTLRARAQELQDAIDTSPSAPNPKQLQQLTSLQGELSRAVERLNAIVDRDLPALNRLLEANSVAPVAGVPSKLTPLRRAREMASGAHTT